MDIFPNESEGLTSIQFSSLATPKYSGIHYGRYEFISTRPEVAVLIVVVLVVAAIIGTVGNISTLLVIATRSNVRHTENIFMMNLAISDLYVTSVADPMSVVAKIEGAEFFEQVPALCQTIASLCTISCVTSLMTIGLMSCNRFFYICVHDKYKRIFTKCNCVLMCISLYFVGGFLVLLNAANIGDHGFDDKSLECIWDRMATYPYTVVFSIALVWIPSITIGACYLKIYLYVRSHEKGMSEQNLSFTAKRFHLAKTLFIIYAVFITCWAPYALLIVTDTENTFPHEIHVCITTFAHLHPSVNWLIYYTTNKNMAAGYRKLFRRCTASLSDEESSVDGLSSSKTRSARQTPLTRSTETLEK